MAIFERLWSNEENGAGEEPDPPPVLQALRAVPGGRIIDVDVREELSRGEEPFSRIMAARAGMTPESVLRVRALFEPVPLYGVMAGHGLSHWTEELADDDWRVWFYAPEALETDG